MALSAGTLGDVNEADARAALKVWIQNATRGGKVQLALAPGVFLGSDGIVSAIRRGELDAFVITALEYVRVSDYVSRDWLLVDAESQKDEYLLLVHTDSGLESLSQLKGRSVAIHQNKASSLAPIWISTLLASKGLDPPEQFFSRTISNTKLARVLLPVFFRQADACIVRRSGFQTMCELNPQLGARLRVVATSPQLVTELFGIHKRCPSPEKEMFKEVLLTLRNTPFGQQVTTLFQSRSFTPQTESCMREVRDLVAAYERIRSRGGGGQNSRDGTHAAKGAAR